MNRREVLLGAGTLAIASLAKAAPRSADATRHDNGSTTLLDAVFDCHRKAEACLSHCLMMFGDTSMAGCAQAVRQTVATSGALLALVSAGSTHAAALAKVCAEVCRDCEAECRKHAAKHEVCRACADACAKMIQEVAKLS